MPQAKKIGEKRSALRAKMFPHIKPDDLWLRARSTGFTTIPRGLPLLLTLMDRLSKGKPISDTYFELWCRMFDECFINLKPREMAFHAGFTGERAEQTWTERMRILRKLGFIETQPGPEGEFSFAVILNPYKVIKKHYSEKNASLGKDTYNALLQRMAEIGATDFDEAPTAAPVAIIPPPKVSSLPPPRRNPMPLTTAKRN